MAEERTDDDFNGVNKLLEFFISVVLFSYLLLLAGIFHNVWNYLIRQRRFKSLHITYFYLLATFVILVRMFWFSLILVVTTDTTEYYNH